MQTIKIGSIVKTEHGIGTVIGFEKAITFTQVIVEFPEPPLHVFGKPFSFSKLCYMEKEVFLPNDGECEPKIFDAKRRATFNEYSQKFIPNQLSGDAAETIATY